MECLSDFQNTMQSLTSHNNAWKEKNGMKLTFFERFLSIEFSNKHIISIWHVEQKLCIPKPLQLLFDTVFR